MKKVSVGGTSCEVATSKTEKGGGDNIRKIG
jgi:hypothetical protein